MAHALTSLLGPEAVAIGDVAGVEITGITADSRKIKPGFLFAALAGTQANGAQFIADAVARGAAAVLVGGDVAVDVGPGVAVVRSAEPRLALAKMAARFYGPGPDTIVAVTGTSGKTSVAEFTRQIFAHLGHQAASLGTLGIIKPSGAVYGGLTTPGPVELAATLAALRAEGITHLAMEASSHGLDQYRLDGVQLTAAAFTNLGRDHMDYHPTVEAYFNAKMRLFRELLPKGSPAVINTNGAYADKAIDAARKSALHVLTVGSLGDIIKLKSVGLGTQNRMRFDVEVEGKQHTIQFPLIGAYQMENALTAAGLALSVGCQASIVLDALSHFQGVPGRLEIVGELRGGLAIVDYAHKPEALYAALDAIRPFLRGKLICVFGCGGDRDKGKRPLMGEIAIELAEVVIVTDDNPRSEDPATIRAEIMAGAASFKTREIGDRGEAIRTAVAMMGAGDVVLVAGKGHETGQIVGATVLPFSDHEVLAAAMAEAEQL